MVREGWYRQHVCKEFRYGFVRGTGMESFQFILSTSVPFLDGIFDV